MSRRSRAGNRPPHHRPAGHPRREHDRPSSDARPRPSRPSPLLAPRPSSPTHDQAPIDQAPIDQLEPVPPVPVGGQGDPIATPAGSTTNGDLGSAPSPSRGGGRQAPAGERRAAETQGSCTAPQLRRFIKSRAYVPMHELRRRFAINGAEDDMALIEVDGSQLFVGLPEREGALLGELLRGGEIGYELSLDPRTPVVVGLFPMRPIPRG